MATLTVPATIDSYMSEAQRTTNFGAAPYAIHDVFYVGGAKIQWRRGIGNFDVSELAGATIDSAKLVRGVLYLVNGGYQAILSRCTRPADWAEHEVTWEQYRAGVPWTIVGGDFDDTGPPAALRYTEPSDLGEHEVPGLEPFVTDALENRNGMVSLITRLANEAPGVSTQSGWHTREAGSQGWRLIIDYSPAVPPSPGRRSPQRSRRAPATHPARPAKAVAGARQAGPRAARRRV